MPIVHDPNTGAYIDNLTGQVYLDAQGTRLSTNTDLNSQAQRNLAIANKMFQNFGGDQRKFERVFADQAELAGALDNVIRGNTPSVAEGTLQAGVEAARHSANSSASGATGANAPLARIQAMGEAGDAQAAANSAAAIARAAEISDATRTKAAVLGQMGTQTNQNQSINATGAVGSAQIAEHGAETQAQIDQREREKWMNFAANMIQGGGNALAVYGTRRP